MREPALGGVFNRRDLLAATGLDSSWLRRKRWQPVLDKTVGNRDAGSGERRESYRLHRQFENRLERLEARLDDH